MSDADMRDDENHIQNKADAAIAALFALEEALGPQGSPLRQRVYQARIIVNEVKYDQRHPRLATVNRKG